MSYISTTVFETCLCAGKPDWGPGASWPEHLVGHVRPCVPPGLHPEVAQDALGLPSLQQGVGVRQDREDHTHRRGRRLKPHPPPPGLGRVVSETGEPLKRRKDPRNLVTELGAVSADIDLCRV